MISQSFAVRLRRGTALPLIPSQSALKAYRVPYFVHSPMLVCYTLVLIAAEFTSEIPWQWFLSACLLLSWIGTRMQEFPCGCFLHVLLAYSHIFEVVMVAPWRLRPRGDHQ